MHAYGTSSFSVDAAEVDAVLASRYLASGSA